MRVNVYAEEMTERVQIIAKEIEGQQFTGLRIYLELPATVNGQQYQGPFMHHPGDDDSSAVTFWGKKDLRVVLRKALAELDAHYESREPRTRELTNAAEVRQAQAEGFRVEARYSDLNGDWFVPNAWQGDSTIPLKWFVAGHRARAVLP